MKTAEIRITVTPEGVDRTEILASQSDSEMKDLAMKTYSQIAFEIYQFRRKVNRILVGNEEEAEQKGIHIYS